MTRGLVDGVIITGPPWKSSGGVPMAGSLVMWTALLAALAALIALLVQGPIAGTMPAMWPTRGACAQAFGGAVAARAAMGVTIASRLPAARISAALHRLCAFFIASSAIGGPHAVCRRCRRRIN